MENQVERGPFRGAALLEPCCASSTPEFSLSAALKSLAPLLGATAPSSELLHLETGDRTPFGLDGNIL